MNRGKSLLTLIEQRKKYMESLNKCDKRNNGLKELTPETYSDEKYFEEKNKGTNVLLQLIKRKLG